MVIREKDTNKPETARRGGDLFIFDNSDTESKVRDYLREGMELS